MSELSNEPPIPEEAIETEESSSSWTMFVTMILLIAGLALSSTMMLHYSSKKRGTTDETPEHTFNVAKLLEKAKTYTKDLQKPKEAQPAEPQQAVQTEERGIGKLFGARTDHVRWPKLKLTGFGSSTEGDGGFAIINGDQVHLGQLIDGKVKLTQIRSLDVVVEYMGESKTLTVDLQN